MSFRRRLLLKHVAMIGGVALLFAGFAPVSGLPFRQIDHMVIEAVIPAAVQVAVRVERVYADGKRQTDLVTLGSGTIISPDGLVLTAAHVVEMPTLRGKLAEMAERQSMWYGDHRMVLDETHLILFGTDGYTLPQPRFTATILEQFHGLDVALLQITGDDFGIPYDPARLAFPFVPLGDSDRVSIGDEIEIFSYPGIAGGGLIATRGEISGFRFGYQQDPRRRTGILTDATVSGGSSGGTAINERGELIGILLTSTALECHSPFEREPLTCLPRGGSIATLLPISDVRDYLARIGYRDRLPTQTAAPATPVSEASCA